MILSDQINNKYNIMTNSRQMIILLLCLCTFIHCQASDYFINYSIQKEGVFLYQFFHDVNDGFYVDLGAYDSIFASNTLNLYSMGWEGINIDANPSRLSRFFLMRPGQTNLNYAIGDQDQFVTLYELAEDSSSTISPKVKDYVKNFKPVQSQIQVASITMKQLCERFFYRRPLFFNLDIEGYGSKALLTNDWNNTKCRPEIIFSQINQQTRISGLPLPETILLQHGYKKWTGRTGLNQIFILSQLYDSYAKKQKQGEKLMSLKQQLNIITVVNVLAAQKKLRTIVMTHHDPATDDIHYHFARKGELVDLNKINKDSNKISAKQNRLICIFNFDTETSYVLLNNQNYVASVRKINAFTFTNITVLKQGGSQYEVYIFDHAPSGNKRPKILISGTKTASVPTQTKPKNISFSEMDKNEASEANKQLLLAIDNEIKNYSALVTKIENRIESQHKQLLGLLNGHYKEKQQMQVIVTKVVQMQNMDRRIQEQMRTKNAPNDFAEARKYLGPLIQNEILMLFAVFFSYLIALVVLCLLKPEKQIIIYEVEHQRTTDVQHISRRPSKAEEHIQDSQ